MTAYQMKEVAQEYRRLRAVVPLGTLRTKKDYARASDATRQGERSDGA